MKLPFVGKPRKKPDGLSLQLVGQTAEGLAISMLLPLVDREPDLAWIVSEGRDKDWDYFYSVAVVSMVYFRLRKDLSQHERAALLKDSQSWKPDVIRAIDDFATFIEHNADKGFPLDVSVGTWILVNVKGEWPSTEQIRCAPGIGAMAIGTAAEFL